MNEFDIELDSDIGTSVSKIKNNIQNNESTHENEKYIITDGLQNQSTYELHNQFEAEQSIREINMNKIVKNIELNIDNFTNNLDNNNQIPHVESIKINQQYELNKTNETNELNKTNETNELNKTNETNELNKTNETNNEYILKFKYLDILLYILIFILLNNNFIIDLIYVKFPCINYIKSPSPNINLNPNLILRSLVFGVLIFLIKKIIYKN